MKAKYKILKRILTNVENSQDCSGWTAGALDTEEQIDASCSELDENDLYDLFLECEADFRNEYDFVTDIEPDYCRHFESKSVCSRMPDGSYVGWTYYYGGGKHAEPESIEWLEDSYNLEVTEEEKMVKVRTYKKIDDETENKDWRN